MVVIINKRNKYEVGVSTDGCITVEYWGLSSIRVIFVNYQTSEL